MMQRTMQVQSSKIKNCLDVSNDFYLDLLGYKPEQTFLQQVSETQWNDFAEQRGLNSNSSGIYLPRNQTAIIQGENTLSLFHEYFGHGLYCEQSLSGRKLVNLERKLLEEERENFQDKKFTLNELQEFRGQNKTFYELEEFRKQNLAKYELFAILTEKILDEYFELNNWEKAYNNLSADDMAVIEDYESFRKQLGDLGFFYDFGLRKIQDKKRLARLSKDLFKDKLNSIQMITHFGSKKPFSDIDFFVISDEIKSSYCDWLDIRAYEIKDVEEKIKTLDSRFTDPIMIGDLIFGKEKYFAKLKNKILNQPITEKAINYNLGMAEYSKKRAIDSSLGEHLQEKNLRSFKTYLTNSIALTKGLKILTFNGIVDYANDVLVPTGNYPELKGGITK